MNLKEFNSLVDLFFYKATKENPNADFLEWLNPKNEKKYTWGETSANIQKLAKVLKENIIDVLQKVYDPEIPISIYDLGLIYNIDIKKHIYVGE